MQPDLPTVPIAVVFPGQGSQRVGMARDFFTCFAASRDVFAEASDALGLDVAALCFENDARLDKTEFTQPAIVTAEMAMMRALHVEFGLRPSYFGGHSLGEYTALCAAGVLTLATAVRVVRERGALMQRAVPEGEGAMVAVISEGIADRDLTAALEGGEVDVANRNSQGQIVLSGPHAAVQLATERIADLLAPEPIQFVSLNVSAPFHSRLMRGIESDLRAALGAAAPSIVAARSTVVTSNLTGTFHKPDIASLIDALARQVSGTVDWVGNMRALSGVAHEIYEVGPNRPLRAFFKSTGREVTAIVSVKSAEKGLTA